MILLFSEVLKYLRKIQEIRNFFIVVLPIFVISAMIQLEMVTRNNLKKEHVYYNLLLPVHDFIYGINSVQSL